MCEDFGEILLDRTPDEFAPEQHVRAVIGVHHRRLGLESLLGIDHRGERFVLDLDQLGRILGDGAALGHHRRDPFADVAREPQCQRIAFDLR